MREEKQLLLDEIKEKFDGSEAFVIMNYSKLYADLEADFRKDIRDAGGSFTVVRKRVFLKAARSSGQTVGDSLTEKELGGHIGVVFMQNDPVQVTKLIHKYCKDNGDNLNVLLGQFEGSICSVEDVKKIASLPSKKEMQAEFLGLLEAPMSQTLAAMEALLTSVPHCLENKSQET